MTPEDTQLLDSLSLRAVMAHEAARKADPATRVATFNEKIGDALVQARALALRNPADAQSVKLVKELELFYTEAGVPLPA